MRRCGGRARAPPNSSAHADPYAHPNSHSDSEARRPHHRRHRDDRRSHGAEPRRSRQRRHLRCRDRAIPSGAEDGHPPGPSRCLPYAGWQRADRRRRRCGPRADYYLPGARDALDSAFQRDLLDIRRLSEGPLDGSSKGRPDRHAAQERQDTGRRRKHRRDRIVRSEDRFVHADRKDGGKPLSSDRDAARRWKGSDRGWRRSARRDLQSLNRQICGRRRDDQRSHLPYRHPSAGRTSVGRRRKSLFAQCGPRHDRNLQSEIEPVQAGTTDEGKPRGPHRHASEERTRPHCRRTQRQLRRDLRPRKRNLHPDPGNDGRTIRPFRNAAAQRQGADCGRDGCDLQAARFRRALRSRERQVRAGRHDD